MHEQENYRYKVTGETVSWIDTWYQLRTLSLILLYLLFLSSADFFNQLFRKFLSGIPPEWQTVWIQIRPGVSSGLNVGPNLDPNCLHLVLFLRGFFYYYYYYCVCVGILMWYDVGFTSKTNSENDQEIPQSQITDNPMAPRGGDTF